MADVDEVRRLAAEFQRVQLTSAKQKLSERNVVELVSKLVELRLLEVVHTADGKEFLTPQHLAREIRDELTAHGGRVNLVDLQQALNIDLSVIEGKVNDLVKHDRNLTLILGQLIDSSYRRQLAEEVNDRLQEQGRVTVGELSRLYDLPPEFVLEVVQGAMGGAIQGRLEDDDALFTESFLKRAAARIRGALSAVTVPTAVGTIRSRAGCQERLFHSVLDDLMREGRVAGSVSAGRQDKSVFYPDVHTRAQNQWIDSFYAQNGYLEFDALSRLGVSDVRACIKRRLKGQDIVMLQSCCLGPNITQRVSATIDDAIANHTWVDVKALLPSCLSEDDVSELVTQVCRRHQGAVVGAGGVVFSQRLVTDSAHAFTDLVQQQAEAAVRQNPGLLRGEGVERASAAKMAGMEDKDDRKEQRRRKAAAGSKKEGTAGREVKTKSSKKKGRAREVESDEDDDPGVKSQELTFMDAAGIEKVLQQQQSLADCPPTLLKEIAVQLHRPLSRQYQEAVRSVFLQSSGASSGVDRRKAFAELQDKVAGLWTHARLFERGLTLFTDGNEVPLARHLLKTVCAQMTNLLVGAMATENLLSLPDSDFDPEARLKVISSLPRELQQPLSRIHLALAGQSLDDFFTAFEVFCQSSHVGVALKKTDKKKERQLVFANRQSLLSQLAGEEDVAMALHLATVVVFQSLTGAALHCPGRLVPAVLTHIQPLMDPDRLATLTRAQDLVVQRLQAEASGNDIVVETLTVEMNALLPEIREIATSTKRKSKQQDEQ